ncbi:MAG: class I SAM-dependent methyltransferase [Defluviicoccus sp.]
MSPTSNHKPRRRQSFSNRIRGVISRFAHHLPLAHALRLRLRPRQQIYMEAYSSRAWCSQESGSGTGSELRATAELRARLPVLLKRLGVRTFMDAPCGDWNWMRLVDLPVERYIGVDIVPAVIEDNQKRYGSDKIRFACLDLTTDPLPAGDLILCRACLFHLSFADGRAVLNNFKKTGATYLLTNYFTGVAHNVDQFTGVPWRPLDLRLPPFGLPEPIESFHDHGDVVPTLVLGLWRFADLRL